MPYLLVRFLRHLPIQGDWYIIRINHQNGRKKKGGSHQYRARQTDKGRRIFLVQGGRGFVENGTASAQHVQHRFKDLGRA